MNALDVLRQMGEEDRQHFEELVERKAWVLASTIEDFTGKEHVAIKRARREGGERLARMTQDRLYRRHHWDSLRWFMFGGNVTIPLPSDTSRPYDPQTNPYVKVYRPGFVLTTDEHDEANPTKVLPDKDYLRLLAYTWVHRDLFIVPKSRQLMVSWLFCSIAAHNVIARSKQRMGFISKKEEDADALIERVRTILDNLPHGRLLIPQYKRISNELSSPSTGSSIHAMNQEAKGLRSYTWSWLWSDETAFAEQADEMFTAGMAAVKGGGRMTSVSTPNGQDTFWGLVTDGGRIAVPAGV